jgi:hypothetical protein
MMQLLRNARHGLESLPCSCAGCGAGLRETDVFCISCGVRITSDAAAAALNDVSTAADLYADDQADSLNVAALVFSPSAPSPPRDWPGDSSRGSPLLSDAAASVDLEMVYHENAQRALEVAASLGLPPSDESLATVQELLKLQAMVRADPAAAQRGQLSICPPPSPSMYSPTPLSPSPPLQFGVHASSIASRPRPVYSEASDSFQVHLSCLACFHRY